MKEDKISISGLELYCHHGVFPEENKLGQKFVVSLELYVDTREAGKNDDLTKSVHYGEVSHFVKEFMEEHTWQLLEAVAERLAEAILIEWPEIRRVALAIEKPWAPIGLPLNTVSVQIERGWHQAYIALGSNIGDKSAYLQNALKALDECHDCKILKVSEFIKTAPYGVTDQDEFLNGALLLRTLKTPEELLETLHEIEAGAGRERLVHWGPRTLDLDIIFFDDQIIDSENLQIPHIEMHKRDFVLEPLMQIAPHKRHPIFHKTVKELKGELDGRADENTK